MSHERPILEGRRVLITGGAGGVGRAVAERMVESGARVLLADRDDAELAKVADASRDSPGAIETVASDLSERQAIAQMFARADDWLGGLACAGVGSGPLMEMDDAGWRYVIESNLASYVACTKDAIDRFRAAQARDGMIVLVGSISVHMKAVGESVYNAAKGGVASFAETLRKEMMREHIRVTLIEPGAIGTGMQPFSSEERARQIEEYQMLPPAEVAEAILFAATRSPGVDVVTLRIEPLIQKIY